MTTGLLHSEYTKKGQGRGIHCNPRTRLPFDSFFTEATLNVQWKLTNTSCLCGAWSVDEKREAECCYALSAACETLGVPPAQAGGQGR